MTGEILSRPEARAQAEPVVADSKDARDAPLPQLSTFLVNECEASSIEVVSLDQTGASPVVHPKDPTVSVQFRRMAAGHER